MTRTEIGVPGGTTDFGPQITQLIAAKPDATFPFFTTTAPDTADTVVVTPDGQTVIIGGLIQNQKTLTETKIPFLGDIPGLGLLFNGLAFLLLMFALFLLLFYTVWPAWTVFTWACLLLDDLLFPAYKQQEIDKPLFIIGNFRSGDSIFKQSPNFRSNK